MINIVLSPKEVEVNSNPILGTTKNMAITGNIKQKGTTKNIARLV